MYIFAFIKLSVLAKNRPHQNNGVTASNESTQKFIDITSHNASVSRSLHGNKLNSVIRSVKILKDNMWQKTRICYNLVAVLFNGTPVRGIKTAAINNATSSSAAQPGYASEDKILQIKQHQNDYTQQYPSVTLILNKTMTEESRKLLEKWKKERIEEMGLDEFNRFYQGM